MGKDRNLPSDERRYPPFWERVVPIALGVIAVVMVILLVIILAVALGLIPGSG